MKKGFIYLLTFSNGKQYVGKTERSIRERMREHAADDKSVVGRAWSKYGKPQIEIIWSGPADMLADREVFFIKELATRYPRGYNRTDGGDGCRGIRFTAESRRKIGEATRNRPVTEQMRKNLRKAWTPERRRAHGEKMRAAWARGAYQNR